MNLTLLPSPSKHCCHFKIFKNTIQRTTEAMLYLTLILPDLYFFETIKMTLQAQSNFVWSIRAEGSILCEL